MRELSLSDKRDLSGLGLSEEDSPQPASQPSANRSILRDRPGEINLPPSLLWQHKSETCTVPPNSKASPPGRTGGQSPFYVTQIALPQSPSPSLAASDLDTRERAATFGEDEWMLETMQKKKKVVVSASCHQFFFPTIWSKFPKLKEIKLEGKKSKLRKNECSAYFKVE